MAPAGMLGFVIYKRAIGPVVQIVFDDSPLFGKISLGDTLVQVHDTDCRDIKASGVTMLMVESAQKERKLVFFTRDGGSRSSRVAKSVAAASATAAEPGEIVVQCTESSDKGITSDVLDVPIFEPAAISEPEFVIPATDLEHGLVITAPISQPEPEPEPVPEPAPIVEHIYRNPKRYVRPHQNLLHVLQKLL